MEHKRTKAHTHSNKQTRMKNTGFKNVIEATERILNFRLCNKNKEHPENHAAVPVTPSGRPPYRT